tara:strand:- start:1522 stop:2091 length:570 start_codon:yes stop_codon:yes gene_type:complete
MKLTTKKLESLILETYSREQKRKILELIKKTRHNLLELQVVQGFAPTLINDIYFYDDTTSAVKRATKGPLGKKIVQKHYRATQRIAEILEEVNQYLVLLETLEIEGNLAFIAQGMIYGGLSGPVAGVGHSIKLNELADMVDTGITFLEDVEAAIPGFLGEGNLGLQAMRDIAESFEINYSNLKNYLDSV